MESASVLVFQVETFLFFSHNNLCDFFAHITKSINFHMMVILLQLQVFSDLDAALGSLYTKVFSDG